MAFWNRKERQNPLISFDEWASFFSFNGVGFPLGLNQTLRGNEEQIGREFAGYVKQAWGQNGPVFACMLVRLQLFSEARFAYRQLRGGRPGDLFGTADLQILETPWPNGTTGDLLARAIQDADLAGNCFIVRRGDRLRRLRPDWVSILLGSDATEWDADVIGYAYFPGGKASGRDPEVFAVDEVAHFAPIPDPLAPYRGVSWLTPIVREIASDKAGIEHKQSFFSNGATPNLVVKFDTAIAKDAFDKAVEMFQKRHEGPANAYKTLFLAGGADATAIGNSFQQMDFKVVQGAGETRIAACSGIAPIIVGLSEGLQSATYSNYAQARRKTADACLRPLWRNFAASVSVLVPKQPAAQLWYDDRDIPFLHEDALDATTIIQAESAAIRLLVDGGFDPSSAVEAVAAGDIRRLTHTGLYSVQLHLPGSVMNGSGNGSVGQVSQDIQQAFASLADLKKRRDEENARDSLQPSPGFMP